MVSPLGGSRANPCPERTRDVERYGTQYLGEANDEKKTPQKVEGVFGSLVGEGEKFG